MPGIEALSVPGIEALSVPGIELLYVLGGDDVYDGLVVIFFAQARALTCWFVPCDARGSPIHHRLPTGTPPLQLRSSGGQP